MNVLQELNLMLEKKISEYKDRYMMAYCGCNCQSNCECNLVCNCNVQVTFMNPNPFNDLYLLLI